MTNENLYILGKRLGLSRNDIDKLMEDKITINQNASMPLACDEYKHGLLYGVISISDFEID